MHIFDFYNAYSNKQPLKARILLFLFIALIALAILRALLPVGIKAGAYYWFDANNIKAEIGKVDISLIDGAFAINNISGKSDTDKSFSLGQLKVTWLWKPLLDKTAFIKYVEIKKFKADAAFYKDGNMNIAGLLIKPNKNKKIKETPAGKNTATPWNATVETIKFSDIEFCLQQYDDNEKPAIDYCTTLDSFNWNGKINYNPSAQDASPDTFPLNINGSLKLNNLVLKNNQLNLTLLDVKATDIKNINMQTLSTINIEQVGINKLKALQRHNKKQADDSYVVAFDHLYVQPISLSDMNNLKLGTIKLDGTQSFIHIDKKGHTEIAKWLPEKSTQKPVAQEKAKPFNFSFGEFIFNTDKHIVFIDNSLKERFSANIHTVNLNLKKLDSRTPDKPSHVILSFKVNKYGVLKIDTEITPLAEKLSVNGKGEISGLDLRMLAPYIRQHVGHDVKSGQLDAELKLDVKKGIIASNMNLTLHQFELKALSKEEAEKLNSDVGFPLNSSLSLLREKDNSIHLNIPVNGDISNPKFDPSDAIVKASSSAISSSVIQYYTPFGLIFAAGALLDLATALNFEPVIFEENMATLTPAHYEQLNKLAELMTERPGIHLTLCGISNKADNDVLFPGKEQLTSEDENKEATEEAVSIEKLIALKKLAESRSDQVKNYLVNSKSINASRLIECSPEYKKEGLSGVEISI